MKHHADTAAGHTTGTPEQNALVESHLYLVQHLVNELAARYPRHIDRGELWSAGAAGLVEASRRFDPSAEVPFARFAKIRIRGAIIDSTRSRDWATRRVRRDLRAVADATSSYEAEHGRGPSSAELAEQLGVSVEEVARRQAASATATLLHLDERMDHDEDGGLTLGDSVVDPNQWGSPDESLEQRELLGTLHTAVRFLPAIQREVVERYFIDGDLLRDIAESFGVTEARVSQIRAEALAAMKSYFATSFDGVETVPDNAPGRRQRASYLADLAAHSTWRTRLDAQTVERATTVQTA